jgi:hypothetical protein
MAEPIGGLGKSNRLPSRDYALIPAIALLTVFLMLGVAETVLHFVFYEQPHDACLVSDAVLGHKARPNCVSHYKYAESPWIENRYNECGYRTKESCGLKPTGAVRAAVLGSSIAAGYMVPYEDSFSALSAETLTNTCHRPVEFQNLGGVGYQWDRLYARVDEALALKSDFVILVLTAFDLLQPQEKGNDGAEESRGIISRAVNTLREAAAESSTWFAIQYYRGQSAATYLKFFLRGRERSGYLRQPFSPMWQSRIDALLDMIGRINDRTNAAHVPLIVVYAPDRAQALLLGRTTEYPDIAPMAIDNRMSAFLGEVGVEFVDLNKSLSTVKDVSPFFYVVNDHLTREGHALLAAELTSHLMTWNKADFGHCKVP